MKKKVLIYIDGDVYLRNYFTFNSFDLKEYDIVLYGNNEIKNKYILDSLKNFRAYILDNPKRRILRFLQCDLQMMKYIDASKSFKFRLKRYSRKKQIQLRWLSFPLIINLMNLYFRFSLKLNNSVIDILNKEKPDLVIVPSQVADSLSLDILDVCKKLGIKTLFLLDGWDNISSKTIFPRLPDYLAVWGKQSIDHAVKIQGFKKENVFEIGTPRFETYNIKRKNVNSPYPFKYIVFTGCFIPFDEISVLKILDHTLKVNNIQDIKIIYRPHPWRAPRNCFDYFIEQDFKNVIMDKQMSGYYYASKALGVDFSLQPSLDYYPGLLDNCIFTISPLTTMVIEAAIMGKYVLTLAYDDGIHYTNPLNALRNYVHFEGIEELSALVFCYEYKDLSRMFIEMIDLNKNKKKRTSFKEELKYYINVTQQKYSDKLEQIINKIIE